jgi:uncharacterized protein
MRTIFLVLSYLSCLVAYAAVYAASFNCTKATTFVEKAICADAALSDLDDQVGQSYKRALTHTKEPETLRAQQRTWLHKQRNTCQDVPCLRQAYVSRLTALDALSAKGPTVPSGGVTGTYTTIGGELRIQELHGGTIRFQVFATWKMNTGEAAGEAPLQGQIATYVNKEEDCAFTFQFTLKQVHVTQAGSCGMGLNVSAGGTYSLSSSTPPQFD